MWSGGIDLALSPRLLPMILITQPVRHSRSSHISRIFVTHALALTAAEVEEISMYRLHRDSNSDPPLTALLVTRSTTACAVIDIHTSFPWKWMQLPN